MPYLGIMAEFRDVIRNNARTVKATEILKECDRLRDEILPNIGVRLEDREGQSLICVFYLRCVLNVNVKILFNALISNFLLSIYIQ